jgi:energy-coupling factor transport system permease protein
MRLNPVTWCAWATVALAMAFIDRNPYIQVVLAMVLANVWIPYRRRHSAGYLKLGLFLACAPILFSVVLSRFGRHLLFTLPAVPIVGGPWTWEALVFGAATGLALLLTIAVFGILQATVRSDDLLAMLPRPLYRAGTVFALALAFAPQTVNSLRSIAEARQFRGRRSGWRAAPALVVPLLLTTLERALQYGESLDARGYGSRRRSRYRPVVWTAFDATVIVLSALAALSLIIAPVPTYDAYESLTPVFPPIISLIGAFLMVTPAVLTALGHPSHGTDHD